MIGNDTAEAIAEYRRAIEIDPYSTDAHTRTRLALYPRRALLDRQVDPGAEEGSRFAERSAE